MIHVELGGNLANELARDVILDAIEFFCLDPDIEITLGWQDVPVTDSHAGVFQEGEGVYNMYLNANMEFSPTRMIELLGHEMTHVKQYEQDGMEDLQGGTVRFSGKFYRMLNPMEYWLSPWEMEARAMEDFFCFRLALHEKWGQHVVD